MKTNSFTENDILRYFYGEMSVEESGSFEQQLMVDTQLQSLYKKHSMLLGLLPVLTFEPSESSIQKILDFSANYHTATQTEVVIQVDKRNIRKYTPRPIVVGMAILFSAIMSFTGYSQFKQETNQKIKQDALEWESTDVKDLQYIHRNLKAIQEYRSAPLLVDSTTYQIISPDETHATIVLD